MIGFKDHSHSVYELENGRQMSLNYLKSDTHYTDMVGNVHPLPPSLAPWIDFFEVR